MKRSKLLTIRLAIMLCVSSAGAAQAQSSGASFLKIDPSAQSYAMGGSAVATSLGAEAITANPALMGLMSNHVELFSTYASLMGGEHFEHVGLSMSLKPHVFLPIDSVGLAVTRLDVGGIPGADAQGNQTGDAFGSGSMAVALGLSSRITSSMRLGATVKALKEQIGGYQSNTVLAGDVGADYSVPQAHGLNVGLSVNNLGQSEKFIGQPDALPISANAGAAMSFGQLTVTAQAKQRITEKKMDAGVGAAFDVGPLQLRGGFAQAGGANNLALKDQNGMAQLMGGLNGGLGIRIGSARMDYAVGTAATEWGLAQRVSLSMQFGNRASGAEAAAASGGNAVLRQSQWNSPSDSVDWHVISNQQ